MTALPRGTVTLLFSDIEGSTGHLRQSTEHYAQALDIHRRLLRSAWSQWKGHELGTEGDGFYVVFEQAHDAVGAALRAQRELAAEPWPGGAEVRVRIGVHTGEPVEHDGAYVGIDVHRAARITAAAHGGQIVVSEATRQLVAGDVPDHARLLDLGQHRLTGLPAPEHLHQVQADGLRSDFPPLKSLGAASTLPRHASPLIGRLSEREELARLLGSSDVRLLTLTGPGGCGKTRLATAVAADLADAFSDGVYFVPLASLTSTDGMWGQVAAVLAPGQKQRQEPGDFLAHLLQEMRALLVLDNLEQLEGAADVVTEILSAAPNISAVATSRRPLHLLAEHEYPVRPLGLPDTPTVGSAAESEAAQLFAQQAKLVRREFQVTEDNVADVAAICARLDGLPLALELAAARTKLLTPAGLLARLDNALALRAQEVDRPVRQQTLGSTIGWSYDLLPQNLQTTFCRLGVLAGGGDIAAVAAVALPPREADPFEVVEDLVDVSLLEVIEGPDGQPRVQLLETIRAFALQGLNERGDFDATATGTPSTTPS